MLVAAFPEENILTDVDGTTVLEGLVLTEEKVKATVVRVNVDAVTVAVVSHPAHVLSHLSLTPAHNPLAKTF